MKKRKVLVGICAKLVESVVARHELKSHLEPSSIILHLVSIWCQLHSTVLQQQFLLLCLALDAVSEHAETIGFSVQHESMRKVGSCVFGIGLHLPEEISFLFDLSIALVHRACHKPLSTVRYKPKNVKYASRPFVLYSHLEASSLMIRTAT